MLFFEKGEDNAIQNVLEEKKVALQPNHFGLKMYGLFCLHCTAGTILLLSVF